MSEIWTTIKLIIKFYPEVKAFLLVIKNGYDKAVLKRNLIKLNGFKSTL
jgi:hypothetical protein